MRTALKCSIIPAMKLSRLFTLAVGLSILMGSVAVGFPASGLPACQGVSKSTISKAELAARAQICADIAGAREGGKTNQRIFRAEAHAIIATLESTYGLDPWCAGSILAIVAQGVLDGKVSAGSCIPVGVF